MYLVYQRCAARYFMVDINYGTSTTVPNTHYAHGTVPQVARTSAAQPVRDGAASTVGCGRPPGQGTNRQTTPVRPPGVSTPACLSCIPTPRVHHPHMGPPVPHAKRGTPQAPPAQLFTPVRPLPDIHARPPAACCANTAQPPVSANLIYLGSSATATATASTHLL